MDPYNIPGVDSAYNPQADLQNTVAAVAPLATTYHSQNGFSTVPGQFQTPTAPSQGVLPAFWGKVESIAGQTGSLLKEGASFVGHSLQDMAIAPVHFAESIGGAFSSQVTANNLQKQQDAMDTRLNSILTSYKSGNLSKDSYLKALDSWNFDNNQLSKQLGDFSSQISGQKTDLVKSAINTAGDVVTVMTLGLTSPVIVEGTQSAATLLDSASQLTSSAQIIGKLAADQAAWKTVSPLAQTAIKIATQQTLEAAGKQATATQVGRSVAARLLLQYPLTYNALSGTGQQLYQELDNNKYGDAVKTAAFNAALLFSGGVIGWGLKYAGKGLKALSVAAGLRPGGMLDALSAQAGNGDKLALGKIAAQQVQNGNEADVKSMIVALESNLKRTNGNIPQAVNNIVGHLEQYIGWGSLKNMTHQQLWDNMVNYWKHAEGLQKLKAAGEIAGVSANDSRAIVPGRFTTQDKNLIAEAVTKGDVTGTQTVEQRLQAWQDFKQANPNIAAANNPNVDKQIIHLIRTTDNPEQLHTSINSIKTQVGLDGIPKDYAAKMAKDGYVAIIPQAHNLPVVPFAETSGKLATNGAQGDFFVHSAAPVPVLSWMGTFLVKAGLSPETAQTRVQDIFTGNFQRALGSDLNSLKLQGDTAEQTVNDTLGKLYNYMKAPTGGMKVFGKYVPISDMRQLSTHDIMRALDISKSDAKNVQGAIMQAYLDVPRSIAGLGDKVISANFKYNPAAKIYSRVQGALRFSWNPIFEQGRLPLKAEILAQMETGGKFPTVAGTNTFMKMFFPGQYKEIDGIVNNPKFRELLPGGLGGEAAASTGTTVGQAAHYPTNALRPVAGLIRSMANRVGMDVNTYIDQNPEDVQNAIQSLLHYDKNNSFLNSPMAKTLNLAFFPFRFNVKVTTYMAKFLAKQPPIVQYAVVKGMMDAHQFLNSPQGQAWYSQHSDAIGLFKYFSPIETISTISNALGLKHDSVGQYGELGGLPFGWIPQMTDSAGLTHFGQAYVNPKTGVIAKDYVPTSMYGAANSAIQDLLGSLFTYPGATAGLPSKGKIERSIVGGLLPGSSKDFNPTEPSNVTPQEQQFSQTVQSLNGGQPTTTSTTNSADTSIKVPKQSSPSVMPKLKSTSAPKKKKADFTPQLLPGQSKLGQL
jgi:hypothetical protein